MFDKKILKNLDWVFLLLLALLMTFSFVVLISASSNVASNPFYYVQRQAIFFGISLVSMTVVALFNYRNLASYSSLAYVVVLLLLLAVLFAPHPSNASTDANRWFYIGTYQLQPSELAKLVFIVVLANYLSRRQDTIHEWRTFWVSLGMAAPFMFLILIEPDLGTTMVFGFMVVVMMWLSGIPRRRMLAMLAIIVLLVGFVFLDLWVATDGFDHMIEELPVPLPMHTYQLNRLIIFINPE